MTDDDPPPLATRLFDPRTPQQRVVNCVRRNGSGWVVTAARFPEPGIPPELMLVTDDAACRRTEEGSYEPDPVAAPVWDAIVRCWGAGVGCRHIPAAAVRFPGGWRCWLPGRPQCGVLLVDEQGQSLQYWESMTTTAAAVAEFGDGHRNSLPSRQS